MSTYCAPCLADLALLREAVTSVSGTAACVAHAVLLTHPGDTPQQRLTRLSDLRAMAEEKLPTASDDDRPRIELLVQEYALAGAMDMTVPLKDLAGDRAPRPPKPRRNRGRDRDRPREPRADAPQGQPRPPMDGAPEATMSPAPGAEAAPEPVAAAPQAEPVTTAPQAEPVASPQGLVQPEGVAAAPAADVPGSDRPATDDSAGAEQA